MAYPFYPMAYPQYYSQMAQNTPTMPQNAVYQQGGVNTQQMQTAPQTANNGLVWVQGMEGAKAHMTAPGVPTLLMDSEGERFYIKTTDASGMPLPLRVFRFEEITEGQTAKQDMSGYVTRDEFEQFKASFGKAAKLTDE